MVFRIATLAKILFTAWLLLRAGTSYANPTDMGKALLLVPDEWATCWAARSGDWSDAATWVDDEGFGRPPTTDDRVVIPIGISVTQDVDTPRLYTLRVDGTLRPKDGATVTLHVGTLVTTMASSLLAGAADSPFGGQWTIRTANYGPAADVWRMEHGVIPMGEVKLYGTDVAAYRFTTGSKIGDSAITLTEPARGWKVGDRLVLPGIEYKTADDDETLITAISNDRHVVSVAPALRFNHAATDREGFDRPMVAVNLSPRSIHFTSESTDLPNRGHLMLMGDGMTPRVFSNVSISGYGRTNKAVPITDPDGLGGGVANPRGRYGWHAHRIGPDITKPEGLVSNCVMWDSPGWGFVNHESQVSFISSAAYKIFGAHFVGENGNETGWFTDCVAIRSDLKGPTTPPIENSGGDNADWGRHGHGFWSHGGGIRYQNNIAYGMRASGCTVQNPFQVKGQPAVQFETKNLPKPYTWPKPTVQVNYVPFHYEGGAHIGCGSGFQPWGLNDNGSPGPKIARAVVKNVYFNCEQRCLIMGYLSAMDLDGLRFVNPKSGYKGNACGNTGVNSNINYRNCEFYGFEMGVSGCPTNNDNTMSDCKARCLGSIFIRCKRGSQDGKRQLIMQNFEGLPVPPDELAEVARTATRLTHGYFVVHQNRQQVHVLALLGDSNTTVLQAASDPKQLWAFTQATMTYPDKVTLDGKYLYWLEESPAFPMNNLVKANPPLFAGLTNQQVWDQHRIAMAGRRAPASAALLPGSLALVSDDPPEQLPIIWASAENKKVITNPGYQNTSQTTGFVLRVQDNSGNFYSAPATNLTDKAWNVVKVTMNGQEYGVPVWCDSAATFKPPW